MIILYLNPMRANAEHHLPIARAETREALMAFVENEKAPQPYKDGHWLKVFRPGSRLEWFNPPDGSNFFFQEMKDVGTLDVWIQETIASWNQMLAEVPPV